VNWDDLIASALIGSARRPLKIDGESNPLGSLSSKLGAASAEVTLLGAASLTSLYRKAGQKALTLPASEQQTAPENSLPECSIRLASILESILTQNEYHNLLPEFCAGLKAQGKVLHRSMLVRALRALRHYSDDSRQALIAVLGERGHWLMQFEERASKLQPLETIDLSDQEAVQNTWETSNLNQRLSLLAQLRQHDPSRARELILSNWQKEPAADRAELLGSLDLGLSVEDEAMLEEALDNRSQTVRYRASGLLAYIPESAFVARMLERARHYIQVEEAPTKGLTGKLAKLFTGNQKVPRFVVTLPPQDDKVLLRDGVDGKQGLYGMGVGAGMLLQIIAATPLDYWTESGFDETSLIKAAQHDEWSQSIVTGWTHATMRQKNRRWAVALVEHPLLASQYGSLNELIELLSREQQEALAVKMFTEVKHNKKLRQVLSSFINAVQRPWSVAFSDAVFEHLYEVINNKEQHNNLFNTYQTAWLAAVDMKRAAHWLPLLHDLAKNREAPMLHVIEKYINYYEFRNHMLEELSR
jgi:hypothetical protein